MRVPSAEQVIAIEDHAGGDEDLVVARQLAAAEHGEERVGGGHADALDEGAVHAPKMRLQAGIGRGGEVLDEAVDGEGHGLCRILRRAGDLLQARDVVARGIGWTGHTVVVPICMLLVNNPVDLDSGFVLAIAGLISKLGVLGSGFGRRKEVALLLFLGYIFGHVFPGDQHPRLVHDVENHVEVGQMRHHLLDQVGPQLDPGLALFEVVRDEPGLAVADAYVVLLILDHAAQVDGVEGPEGVDVVVDAIKEVLDDDGAGVLGGLEPGVEAGRRVSSPAFPIPAGGLFERDGALLEELLEVDARISRQLVDGVVVRVWAMVGDGGGARARGRCRRVRIRIRIRIKMIRIVGRVGAEDALEMRPLAVQNGQVKHKNDEDGRDEVSELVPDGSIRKCAAQGEEAFGPHGLARRMSSGVPRFGLEWTAGRR